MKKWTSFKYLCQTCGQVSREVDCYLEEDEQEEADKTGLVSCKVHFDCKDGCLELEKLKRLHP